MSNQRNKKLKNEYKSRAKEENLNSLIRLIDNTLAFLNKSSDSDFCARSCSDLILELTSQKESLAATKKLKDPMLMKMIFAPTGSLQDIAIDNGWGEEYLSIAEWADVLIT